MGNVATRSHRIDEISRQPVLTAPPVSPITDAIHPTFHASPYTLAHPGIGQRTGKTPTNAIVPHIEEDCDVTVTITCHNVTSCHTTDSCGDTGNLQPLVPIWSRKKWVYQAKSCEDMPFPEAIKEGMVTLFDSTILRMQWHSSHWWPRIRTPSFTYEEVGVDAVEQNQKPYAKERTHDYYSGVPAR